MPGGIIRSCYHMRFRSYPKPTGRWLPPGVYPNGRAPESALPSAAIGDEGVPVPNSNPQLPTSTPGRSTAPQRFSRGGRPPPTAPPPLRHGRTALATAPQPLSTTTSPFSTATQPRSTTTQPLPTATHPLSTATPTLSTATQGRNTAPPRWIPAPQWQISLATNRVPAASDRIDEQVGWGEPGEPHAAPSHLGAEHRDPARNFQTATVVQDGGIVSQNGTFVLVYGDFVLPDGTFVLLYGDFVLPDGTFVLVNGLSVLVYERLVFADGPSVLSDRPIVLPKGDFRVLTSPRFGGSGAGLMGSLDEQSRLRRG